jgi:hypothetical protein
VEIKVYQIYASQMFAQRGMPVDMLQTENLNTTDSAWEGVFAGTKLASRISFLITVQVVTIVKEEHPQN